MMEDTKRDPNSRHYDAGNLETLDIIKAKLTPEQYEGFLLGNIIKYSCRANFWMIIRLRLFRPSIQSGRGDAQQWTPFLFGDVLRNSKSAFCYGTD